MKSAGNQFLVTCPAFGARTFSKKTGGEKQANTSKWYDGGATSPDVLASSPETTDVVLTNAYDPDVDGQLLQTAKAQVGILRTTLSIVPLLGDMTRVPSGRPDVYTNALLKGVKLVEVDANSGDPATWELTWAVGNVS
jgi:hypothetical protein